MERLSISSVVASQQGYARQGGEGAKIATEAWEENMKMPIYTYFLSHPFKLFHFGRVIVLSAIDMHRLGG